MKIMIYADTYNGTSGYSKVGRELAQRLTKLGHKVLFQEIVTFGSVQTVDGIVRLPVYGNRGTEPFLSGIMNHINTFKPDVFMPISDPFLMKRDKIDLIDFGNIRVIPYFMLDSNSFPDNSREFCDKAEFILTASQHAVDIFKSEGYDARLLYHGVNFNEFQPLTSKERKKFKELNGIDQNKKVFLTVGRNQPRKRHLRLIEAIAKFNSCYKDKKDDVVFLIHASETNSEVWNLPKVMERLSIKYNVDMDNIIFTKDHRLGEGLNTNDFIKMWNCADYYITASSGEGFGLPIAEAMASKKLVLAPDNTTHTEFLSNGRGVLIDNDGFSYVGFGLRNELVSINGMAATIKCVLEEDSDNIAGMINGAYGFAKNNFNWDEITQTLDKYLRGE